MTLINAMLRKNEGSDKYYHQVSAYFCYSKQLLPLFTSQLSELITPGTPISEPGYQHSER